MSLLRRWYPFLWLLLVLVGVIHASMALVTTGLTYSWLGALTGCATVAVLFLYLIFGGSARTSENLPLLHSFTALAPLLILLDLLKGNTVSYWPLLYAVVIAYGGTLVYLRWYSVFNRKPSACIQPGADMPAINLTSLDGETLDIDEILADKPTILMFIRGNWCPLCIGQVKELAAEYRSLATMGAQAIVVSSQPASKSITLARRLDAPIRFLVDTENKAAEALGILNKNGAIGGAELLGHSGDTAYPTTLIINALGRIVYADQTGNYRLRPEPAEFLQVLKLSSGGGEFEP